MALAKSYYFTSEQYLERERAAEYKSEYLDGQIYAMAGATRRHNMVGNNISTSLTNQLRSKPCEVYSGDMRVQADQSRQYFYPDAVVVCGEPEFRDEREDTLLNPTVVIEVLSRSTEAFDRGEKFFHYRQMDSLTEYLLVSQDERRIEQFTRQPDGSWRLTETRETGAAALESIACTLALEDVYDKVTLGTPVRLTLDEPR